ncbi:DUF2291 family protein [Spelaeicoccus albus]|uniref:Putative lipoprotein n=1 Tax=Spelaeicoccus albus TaxID=1280376 RepID=A0A7Z0D5J3_9MICO|nr:DUF2291 family protein [Spelaeicoccus albus]NYI69208.1 putative lipoprotein [Spelaeicoccus albus]
MSHAASRRMRTLIISGAVIVLLVAMGFGTKVQTTAEANKAKQHAATPANFAKKHYSADIVPAIEKRAVPLPKVSKAIAKDQKAAAKKYGVIEGTSAPVYSVTLTGKAGKVDGTGRMKVTVAGLAKGATAYVQMGPALNGTAIRDASGTVHFPQFKNQIAYQNVGAQLNNQVKKKVLAKVDAKKLAGKTVTVTGAFQFVNPAAFMIVPVKIKVGK